RAILVLGADREMRVEQRRRLPPQYPQRASAAALGRLVFEPLLRLVLRFGDTAIVEHLARQRRGEAERDHLAHEDPSRHATALHLTDQTMQRLLVHDRPP